jgi:hypothetical protein
MAGGSGPGGPAGPGGPDGQPSEEELRAAYEAELARITSADMMLQAAVSLLNIGSYRLVPRPPEGGQAGAPGGGGPDAGGGQDLEQVRDSIDGVRALLEILERRVPGGELRPLRDALSQLQMAYAREVQTGAGAALGGEQPGGGEVGDGQDGGSGGEPGGQGGPDGPGGSGGGPGGSGGPGAPGGSGGQPGQDSDPGQAPTGPGPAESSGRLWVPGR